LSLTSSLDYIKGCMSKLDTYRECVEKSLRLPRAVEHRLEELAETLRRAVGDVEAYLFGSYAKGEWLEDSDIDIIVV